MTDLNHVVLIGRLTQDAELKYTQNGYAISTFSIAVNRSRKNGDQWVEEASFFEISLYGKSAENLKPYLVKGKQVAIDGELRQDRWESDGQKRSKVVVVANNIQLVGGNNGANGQAAGGYASNQPQQRPSYQQNAQAPQQGYNQGGYNAAPNYGGQGGYSAPQSQTYGGDAGFSDDIPF